MEPTSLEPKSLEPIAETSVIEGENFDHYRVMYNRNTPYVRFYLFDKWKVYDQEKVKRASYVKISPEKVKFIQSIVKKNDEFEKCKIDMIEDYERVRGKSVQMNYIATPKEIDNTINKVLAVFSQTDDDDIVFPELLEIEFMSDKKITLESLAHIVTYSSNTMEILKIAKNCLVKTFIQELRDFMWMAWDGEKIVQLTADLDKWLYKNEERKRVPLSLVLDLWTNKGGFFREYRDLCYVNGVQSLIETRQSKVNGGAWILKYIRLGIPLTHIFIEKEFYSKDIICVKTGDILLTEYLKWKQQLLEGIDPIVEKDAYDLVINDDIRNSKAFTMTFKELKSSGKDSFYRAKKGEKSKRVFIYKKFIKL